MTRCQEGDKGDEGGGVNPESEPTLTRAEWITEAASRLGYPGHMPHDLYRRLESMHLTGVSVVDAVAREQLLAGRVEA